MKKVEAYEDNKGKLHKTQVAAHQSNFIENAITELAKTKQSFLPYTARELAEVISANPSFFILLLQQILDAQNASD